ncbi:MAG: hypothetical protein ACK4ND_11615 [Cytophagaceae bacterium]
MRHLIIIAFLLCTSILNAQSPGAQETLLPYSTPIYESDLLKANTRKYGLLLGVQRGRNTFWELGVQKQWKKLSIQNPRMWAVYGTMMYNLPNNTLAYQTGVWTKKGVDLTYGMNFCYFSDFYSQRIGGGPVIGFRFLGFHLMTGYNYTFGPQEMTTANNLHISARYFIPTFSTTEIERSKKKKNKSKNSGKNKKSEKKGLFSKKEPEPEKPMHKFLRKLGLKKEEGVKKKKR